MLAVASRASFAPGATPARVGAAPRRRVDTPRKPVTGASSGAVRARATPDRCRDAAVRRRRVVSFVVVDEKDGASASGDAGDVGLPAVMPKSVLGVPGDRVEKVLAQALPVMGGMASQNVLNLADAAMVGRLGTAVVVAVVVKTRATLNDARRRRMPRLWWIATRGTTPRGTAVGRTSSTARWIACACAERCGRSLACVALGSRA